MVKTLKAVGYVRVSRIGDRADSLISLDVQREKIAALAALHGWTLVDADLLSHEEIDRLLRACSRRAPSGRRNRALIAVLWRCGLRISESLALGVKDVDLAGFSVTVQHGKSGRRVVGLDLGTALLLDQWLVSRRKLRVGSQAPLFCTLQGGIEPLRESCRLQSLRGWSHVRDIEEVFTGGS